MRFKSAKSNSFQIFAISGVNTISFGIQAGDKAKKGLLGFGVFGTVPGAMTLTGGLVIAASGLYTAHRERIRTREARLAAAGIRRS